MTVFTKNKTHRLLGNFEVKYSKQSDITVHSTLTFNDKNDILKNTQTFLNKTLKEEIKVYDETEIVALLTKVGFKTVDVIQEHSDYCSVFVVQKRI